MTRAFVMALVGAESTGKTTLAEGLAIAIAARGLRVIRVDEVLREFCARQARTPRQDEQEAIAREQSRRIEVAATRAEVVVADTTALMIAVYSDIVFADPSLYCVGELAQRACDLTLLTALDLPWKADGLQRDGAHVQGSVDARLRAALVRAGVRPESVAGSGSARSVAALAAFDRAYAEVRHDRPA